MGKKRRTFSAAFKHKVACEALAERQTLSELAQKYELHPNQIVQWKNFQSRAMKKTPLSSGGGVSKGARGFKEVLKKFLFDLRVACHNNSLMVCRVS